MTDIPILFSGPMVRALLDRKTQTRRLAAKGGKPSRWLKAKPGDRLWVRESLTPVEEYASNGTHRGTWLHYAMDSKPVPGNQPGFKGVPSIHMPRRFSRLTLTLTEVRTEKLQAIDFDGALREGCEIRQISLFGADTKEKRDEIGRIHFRSIWSDINGRESWDENPEVVVLSFNVERRNIDA